MFRLKLFDRNGEELNLGDIVKISNGKGFSFYSEVKYLENEQVIAPFHTFSFHSFVKVDSVPANTKKSPEERYNIWIPLNEEADTEAEERAKSYLVDWRCCETLINERIYRIEPL